MYHFPTHFFFPLISFFLAWYHILHGISLGRVGGKDPCMWFLEILFLVPGYTAGRLFLPLAELVMGLIAFIL